MTHGCPDRRCLRYGANWSVTSAGRDPHRDLYTGGPQRRHSPTGHQWVGVFNANDHSGDARGDDGVGTGRRPTLVGTGLEGREQGRTPRVPFPGLPQRRHLGVGTTRRSRRPPEGQSVIAGGDHDAADPRVGRRGPPDGFGQFNGASDVLGVPEILGVD